MMKKEIKTMDEATRFYNDEFNKIANMDTTDQIKVELLNQLNRTMTNIYTSLK